MPFHIGPWEVGLILVIILIIFGVGKLPQVGGAIGKGLRAFRKGQQGEDLEEEQPEKEAPKPKRKSARKIAKNSTK
ncbi:twin-arginine translocase TatA/TatE family subunit [Chloroflexota bacterium]